MQYTPINKAHFDVRIKKGIMQDMHFYWNANTTENTGISSIYSVFVSGGNFAKPEDAEADFKEFAELNGIEDYIIYKFNP